MLTNSLKILDTTKTGLLELIFFESDQKNMTTILQCRFMQSFGHSNMLTVHKCSDTGLFGHLNNSPYCSL